MTRAEARGLVWHWPAWAGSLLVLCIACGGRTALPGGYSNSASGGRGAAAAGAGSANVNQGGALASNGGAGAGDGGAAGSAGQSQVLPVLTAPDARRTPPTFCTIDQWCGSNANFTAIWGSAATDIWVVANNTGQITGSAATPNSNDYYLGSALLHWDGLRWSATQFDGTRYLRSIWGSAKDDVWLTGDGGIRHFDGKGWSPVRLPAAMIGYGDLLSISGSSAKDVWAVGAAGTILHFDGSVWSRVSGPTTPAAPAPDLFRSVWATAAEVWVVGDKTVNHFDRTSWSSVARPEGSVESGVWGRAEHEAWLAGPGGTLERWSSNAGQTVPVAGATSTATFRALWGGSNGAGWAMGEKGALAQWNRMGWSAAPHLTDANLNGAWSDGRSTWFVGDNGTFLELDGNTWSASPLGARGLKRLWSASSSDVWAAGKEIAHWDGSLWQDVARPGSDTVLALWGSSSSDIWAVGEHGLLLHWDGAAWRVSASPTTANINGVWGSASNDVWAVDAEGRFLHFDGTSFAVWATPSIGPLQSVWGRNARDVIAVGSKNRMHFDGVNWSLMPPHTTGNPTYTLAFGNGSLVWIAGYVAWSGNMAGGAYPELGRWDGMALADDLEPANPPFGIVLSDTSVGAGWGYDQADVWLFLTHLTRLVHWNGAEWSFSASGGGTELVALRGTTSDLWALTSYGQVIRKARN